MQWLGVCDKVRKLDSVIPSTVVKGEDLLVEDKTCYSLDIYPFIEPWWLLLGVPVMLLRSQDGMCVL